MASSLKPIIIIKLGGSVITNKTVIGEANLANIQQLAEEIAALKQKSDIPLVLVHGGGSFSHPPAKEYQTRLGLKVASVFGAMTTIKAGADLNKLVIEELIKQQLPAVPVHPVSTTIMSKGKLKHLFMTPLLLLLENGFLPVTYGDVVMDEIQGCADTSSDQIVGWLAIRLRRHGYDPKIVIHIGTTNGVYDQNMQVIPEINQQNYQMYKSVINGSEGIDVTGGMAGKVYQALLLAKKNIPSLIISAEKGNLTAAVLGHEVAGTWIRQNNEPVSHQSDLLANQKSFVSQV